MSTLRYQQRLINDDVHHCPGLCCIPSLLERQVTTQPHGLRGMLAAIELCDNIIICDRYQVHLKDRGVLLQKRYLVNIKHENAFDH